jgi:hypothetical protein
MNLIKALFNPYYNKYKVMKDMYIEEKSKRMDFERKYEKADKEAKDNAVKIHFLTEQLEGDSDEEM